jgi:hypothetical protein
MNALAANRGDPGAGLEHSSFVYGIFHANPTCSLIKQRVAELDLDSAAILSIEDGATFVLDRSDGAGQIACAIRTLAARHKKTKLMLLQDVSFLDNVAEAQRRVLKAAFFLRSHDVSVSALVLDIEPYITEQWACGGHEGEERIARSYLQLLRDLRTISRPVPLEAAVPWWATAKPADSAFSATALAAVLDAEYLMFYGDEGGPIVNGSAQAIIDRFPTQRISAISCPFYIALATYESKSHASLEQEIGELDKIFAQSNHYSGTAVFEAGGTYNFPLLRTLNGAVTDPIGRGLPHTQVSAGSIMVHSNACGQFNLHGLPATATLTLTAPGYRTRREQVTLRPPGRETDWPTIVLYPLAK